MVNIPAYCHRCDFAFQPNAFDVENSTNVTITNSTVTCPKCGFLAKVLEGTFDVKPDGKILMKSGMPPLTRRMLEQFELLTREVIRRDSSLPEYAARSAKIHPKLPEVVSKAATKVAEKTKKHATTLTVGTLVLALIGSCSTNIEISLDVNQFFEQLASAKSDQYIQKDQASAKTDAAAESPADESP